MGKGDKKSRRGKITNGTYGVRRPRKKKVKTVVKKATTKAKKAKAEAK
ncbi:30S ribosomal protein THX [Seonamhaeicola sp.]|nr:30S ribosomal protein THX [Seonamhaeicola sp.]